MCLSDSSYYSYFQQPINPKLTQIRDFAYIVGNSGKGFLVCTMLNLELKKEKNVSPRVIKKCGAYWSQNHTQRLQGTSIWWPLDANQEKGEKKINKEKDLPLQKT